MLNMNNNKMWYGVKTIELDTFSKTIYKLDNLIEIQEDDLPEGFYMKTTELSTSDDDSFFVIVKLDNKKYAMGIDCRYSRFTFEKIHTVKQLNKNRKLSLIDRFIMKTYVGYSDYYSNKEAGDLYLFKECGYFSILHMARSIRLTLRVYGGSGKTISYAGYCSEKKALERLFELFKKDLQQHNDSVRLNEL